MLSFLKNGKLSSEKNPPTLVKTDVPQREIPWVEKYRPKTVDEVVEQSEAVAVLQECMAGADLPNLLFYGPPGTGKTSTILAAVKQLFGDIFRQRILELNASDERGIQVIREKIKNFAQLTASATRPNGKPCLPLKIVILDEADSMTHPAQAALRRTMEKYTTTTRFCLICNYITRIIQPLTSRCTKFRFKPLSDSMIFDRLQYICEHEKIMHDDVTLNALVEKSGGDMRRAITCLQSCAKLCSADEYISLNDVYEVTGLVPMKWLNDYIQVCQSKNVVKIMEFINVFLLEAYSTANLLEELNELMINSDDFSDIQKAKLGEKLGLVSFRLHDGGSDFIQLLDMAYSLMDALV